MELDLTLFVAVALSKMPKGYPLIDKIYKKNKFAFYKRAVDSEFYDNSIVNEGSIIQTEYARKALGILLYEPDDADTAADYNSDIYQLVKEAYPYAWQYVKNNPKIRFTDFFTKLVKKRKGLNSIGDDELNSTFVIVLFLCQNLGKTVDTDDYIYNTFIHEYLFTQYKHSCKRA